MFVGRMLIYIIFDVMLESLWLFKLDELTLSVCI
jgi:hypothetical protein